eukprot:9060892-Pyramimonas_sp.AAC.1
MRGGSELSCAPGLPPFCACAPVDAAAWPLVPPSARLVSGTWAPLLSRDLAQHSSQSHLQFLPFMYACARFCASSSRMSSSSQVPAAACSPVLVQPSQL